MVRLRELRQARGLSQAELAGLAGVSRQLVGAAESGRHFPAVDAALRIARALGASVEEVFGGAETEEEAPARLVDGAPPGAPLRVARVGGERVAVPLGDPGGRGFFSLPDGVAGEDGAVRVLPGAQLDGLVVAGCDPALGIAEALLGSHGANRLVAVYESTGRAVALLAERLVHGALVHGPEGALPEPPVPVRRWRVGAWQAGIAYAPALGHPSLEALTAGGIELAQRDETAASQQALRRALLGLHAEPPPGPIVGGHLEAARRTSIGGGAAVSMEPAAEAFRVGFLPLETHVVDLWVDERWRDHAGVALLVDVLRSARFRERVAALGSYDLTDAGTELEPA
ncbi:MAG TPA: helix-turn-helix domain-containing protein [Gaiellaceae bacterium]|nr:helix-turn-helix domain-containing protein [Gaiellaceae bacterium]